MDNNDNSVSHEYSNSNMHHSRSKSNFLNNTSSSILKKFMHGDYDLHRVSGLKRSSLSKKLKF